MRYYHSSKPGTDVYHNNPNCKEGNNIENKYYARGKGNKKRLCKRCGDLK